MQPGLHPYRAMQGKQSSPQVRAACCVAFRVPSLEWRRWKPWTSAASRPGRPSPVPHVPGHKLCRVDRTPTVHSNVEFHEGPQTLVARIRTARFLR